MSNRIAFGAGRSAVSLCVTIAMVVFGASSVRAAERVLFPAPLHITREISDSISGKSTRVDEYCHGNRVVAISGRRTAIVDMTKAEVTTIDFDAGTYSIDSFETLAGLNGFQPARRAASWNVERKSAGDVELKSEHQSVRVKADHNVTLSREALEVLIGAGYPNRRNDAADAVLTAARAERSRIAVNAAEEYHLPVEQIMRIELAGEVIETRNVVVRVGNETAPVERIAIPAGAKQVESDAVAARRMLEELDGGAPSSH